MWEQNWFLKTLLLKKDNKMEDLLGRIESNTEFLRHVITDEESWIFVYDSIFDCNGCKDFLPAGQAVDWFVYQEILKYCGK